ncbi:hypothetical protein [Pseudomonas entomophila]|uniref:Uncharacterized protein n=1 Tax=Pseudomonas entomophila TaxID=312306 RepID=A0ABY9QPS3_9PSED|nr:hypothetical protein [Pseudomonas entomophila]WMW05661.1 hypothetical protein RAH46_25635 [Pseudomonas entomophila]
MSSREQAAYPYLKHFVQLLSKRDGAALADEFGLGFAVVEELLECVQAYYAPSQVLSIASLENHRQCLPGRRPLIDFFDMDDGMLGAECVLLVNDEPGEAVLHLGFSFQGDHCELHFKYIGA